jgi:PAS domain S-box-containing protein
MGKKRLKVAASNIENLSEYLLPKQQMDPLVDAKVFLEHLPNAVVVIDQTGQLISHNQRAENILGEIPLKTRPEDWPKQFGFYLIDGKTPYPAYDFPLLRALRGERVEAEELIKLDGEALGQQWLSMYANPLTLQDGKISGAFIMFDDITASKQLAISREIVKKRVEASYVLSHQIAKIGNDPLQILNAVVHFAADIIGDGCVAALLNSHGSRLKIVALDHNKATARAFLMRSALAREYRLKGRVEQVILSGEPLLVAAVDPTQLRHLSKPEQIAYIDNIGVQSVLVVPIKGRKRVLGTLILVRDRDGNSYTIDDQTYLMDIAYRTGMAIDNSSLVHSLRVETSGRRIAEEALELSEVRFRSIFTSTTLGIKLLDLDGKILETNPAFQNTLGYTEEELKGKPISDLWHPQDIKLSMQLLDKLKNDRVQSFQLEHRLISKDGSVVWYNVTFTAIKKNDREESIAFIVAIAENITKRKRIEAEMAEMKNRLHDHVEMERLQLAQELHDGPLQELYSSIYKIENWGAQLEPENREKVEGLKEDLLKVVQGLRNTAKNLRPPALTNFGLEKAIRSHAEEFGENHPELTIHLNLAQDRQLLPEDIRLILFRIYQNTLTNVIRHAQASEVYVRFAFDAEEAQLEIRDNGIGFEVPSSWVELVRQGHFGLAGAVERVSLLGGTFFVDSAPGQGTTARVTIPIIESANNVDKGRKG